MKPARTWRRLGPRVQVYRCLNGACHTLIQVGRFPLCRRCRRAAWLGGILGGGGVLIVALVAAIVYGLL